MISIDFWDTLVDGRVGGETRKQVRYSALQKVCREYGRTIEPKQIEKASQDVSREFNHIWFNEQRTPKTRELVSKILNNLGIPADKMEYEFLVDKFEASLLDGPPAIINGAAQTIHNLSKEYRLTLISDTMYSPGRVIRRYMEEREILHFFDVCFFSDEAGYSKPNPKAFRRMLDDTNSNAQHSYHIGDRVNTDIAGAKAVGMKAILFSGISSKDEESGDEPSAQPDYRCKNWKEVQELLL